MKQRKTNHKYYIGIIIVAIIIVFGFIYILKVNKSASATWWNDSWAYKKMITIDKDKVGIISDLEEDATLGVYSLIVKDVSLFEVGQTVVIKDSNGGEINEVRGIDGNTLVFTELLKNNYVVADGAFVKNQTTSADLLDFPVLVDIQSDPDLASNARSDGYDIVFVSSDETTQLKHEIESYNRDDGNLTAWVKIPNLSATEDTIIYMYYGNPDYSDPPDSEGAWDSNYVTVQHLKDLTKSTVEDSTVNNYDGVKMSDSDPYEIDSKISKAQKFNGRGSINHGMLRIGDAYTAEAWIQAGDLRGDEFGFTVFSSSVISHGYPLLLTIGRRGEPEVNLSAFEDTIEGHSSVGANLNTDDWFHIVVIATKRGAAKVYVNGVERLSFEAGRMDWYGDFTIGNIRDDGSAPFAGIIDEVRVSDSIRGFDWVATEYKNQNSPSTFYIIGSEETKPAVSISASSTIFMGGSTGATLPPPILYYNFDEGYGATAYNYASTTNNGTISGATWSNDGKFGKALVFSGSNNYVDTGFSDNLSASDFSASAWIKIPNGVSTSYVVAQSHVISPYASDWFFPYHSGGSIFWFRGVQLGTYFTINDGLWHHLMLVWDQSEAKYSAYVDGKYIGKSSTVSNYGGVGSVKIGVRGDLATTFFTGSIDEVKIYNYALSQDQVKVDYNNGMATVMGSTGTTTSASAEYCVPGDTSYCASPSLEYKFEKRSGATAYDTSGNGNDATISGSAFARGKFGSAMSFDGINDSTTKTNSSGLVSSNGTISYWLYLPTKDISHTIFYIYETATADYIRNHIISNNTIDLVIEDNDVVKVYVTYDLDNLGDFTNKWLYFSWVQDGSSVKLYINGQLKTLSGTNLGTWWTSHLNSPITTKLGYGWGYFKGSIDDVKVYNYARTPSQVAWDYNRGAPIAHYKFDECSGATIHDESGNLNNGTITIGAIGSQTALGTCTDSDTTHAWYNGSVGKYNSGLSFDGIDDYVSRADQGASDLLRLNNSTGLTISLWMNPTGIYGTFNGLVTKGGSNSGYILRFVNDGLINTRVGNGSTWEDMNLSMSFTPNTWSHLAYVFNGNAYSYYVDGKYVSGGNSSLGFVDGYLAPLYIGSDEGAANRYFSGKLDDVKIFNYALTSSQIKELYNGSAVRFNE